MLSGALKRIDEKIAECEAELAALRIDRDRIRGLLRVTVPPTEKSIEPKNKPKVPGGLKLHITKALGEGPLTPSQIVEKLKDDGLELNRQARSTVYTTLKRSKRLFIQEEDGKTWRLNPETENQIDPFS